MNGPVVWLLDTNVISELRKLGDGRADARVAGLECSSDHGSGADVGGPAGERTAMKWSGPSQDTRDPSRARSRNE